MKLSIVAADSCPNVVFSAYATFSLPWGKFTWFISSAQLCQGITTTSSSSSFSVSNTAIHCSRVQQVEYGMQGSIQHTSHSMNCCMASLTGCNHHLAWQMPCCEAVQHAAESHPPQGKLQEDNSPTKQQIDKPASGTSLPTTCLVQLE
jgi:hypothetical protein